MGEVTVKAMLAGLLSSASSSTLTGRPSRSSNLARNGFVRARLALALAPELERVTRLAGLGGRTGGVAMA